MGQKWEAPSELHRRAPGGVAFFLLLRDVRQPPISVPAPAQSSHMPRCQRVQWMGGGRSVRRPALRLPVAHHHLHERSNRSKAELGGGQPQELVGSQACQQKPPKWEQVVPGKDLLTTLMMKTW